MKQFRLHILPLAVLAVFSLFVASCSSSNKEDAEEIYLTVQTTNVTSTAGEQFIKISAPGRWFLQSDQNWLTLSSNYGSGSKTDIILSYTENNTGENRTALITLTGERGAMATTIFTQSKYTSPSVEPETGTTENPGWMELPKIEGKSGQTFVTHERAANGTTGRSYSYLWSSSNQVALWVAYPLNRALISSGSRTNQWGYDPKLASSDQPVLFNAYRGGYDRGHQIPSADRLSYNDNVKTFYFTNMTPQLNSLNSGIWASLESMVRSWANSCDTLYVVTGCTVSGSSNYAYDNNGKAVTVPTGYFKAVLRYQSNSTLGHSGYMGLAVYLEHRAYSQTTVTSGMSMSIADLEHELGIELFTNLPAKVGETVATQIKSENPANVNYWW